MTPKDFEDGYDDGEDLVLDGLTCEACILMASIGIAFLIIMLVVLWGSL